MKNGMMSKGLAGLGQGLAAVGTMGYQAKLQGDLESQRAEIMALRDDKLSAYTDGRADLLYTRTQGIHREDNIAKGNADSERDRRADVRVSEQEKRADARQNAELEAKGKIPYTLPPGTRLVDRTGKEIFYNKPETDPEEKRKSEKHIDDRINSLRLQISARMGQGFMEKMTEPDRKDFDTIFKKASKLIRDGSTMEDAYTATVDELERLKSRVSVPAGNAGTGESDSGSSVSKMRNLFKY